MEASSLEQIQTMFSDDEDLDECILVSWLLWKYEHVLKTKLIL